MVFKCCCIFAESTMTNTLKNRNYEKLKKNRQNNKSRIINRNSIYFTFACINHFKSINHIKHHILIMEDYNDIVVEALKMYRNSLKDDVWTYDTENKINRILTHLEEN